MRGEDRRDVHGADQRDQRLDALCVHAGERLVEQEQAFVLPVGETAREGESAPHAAGEGLRRGVDLVSESDAAQPVGSAAPLWADNLDLAAGRQPRDQAILLKHQGDLARRRAVDAAALRLFESRDEAQKRRLAAAGGAGQRRDARVRKREREIPENALFPVGECDTVKLHARSPFLPSRSRRAMRSTVMESATTTSVHAKSAGVSR